MPKIKLSRPCLVYLAALGLVAGLHATTVTSVSCATPTAAYQMGVSTCDTVGSYGYSQASVSASVNLPATASDAALIDTSLSASAVGITLHGVAQPATGQASANVGITFDTTGPVRNGILELNFTQTSWQTPSNGVIAETLTIGSSSTSPDGSDLSSVLIPVELGTDFNFDLAENLAAIGGSASGTIGSQISLLAFESDGVTPVQLFDPPGSATPEPASAGIAGLGIIGLGVLFKRRR